MMRRLQLVMFVLIGVAFGALTAAGQEKPAAQGPDLRVALVIGNAKYPQDEAPLRHPINDARAVADELRLNDFQVVVGENLSKRDMRAAIAGFVASIKPGSVALFYFSGFGIQAGRQSYLIPVDSQIWAEGDVRLDGILVDSVLADMQSRGAAVNLMIVDAARRNPYERRFRSLSTGLAPISMPRGSLVLFSAVPGMVVADRDADRSVFSEELCKELRSSRATARNLFFNTQLGVSNATAAAQVPWVASSLTADFYFGRPLVAAITPPGQSDIPQTSTSAPTKDKGTDVPGGGGAPTKPLLGGPPPSSEDIRRLSDELRRNPKNASVLFKRGVAYTAQKEYRRAIDDFSAVIGLNPAHVEALNNRCWLQAIVGQMQAAQTDCTLALAIEPHFADAFDSRGLARLKMGELQRAIEDFDAALSGNPEQASALFGRGLAKIKTGNIAGGNADIAQAKSIKPDIAEEFEGYGVH